MADPLSEARRIAEMVRFSADRRTPTSPSAIDQAETIRSYFRQSGLRISSEVSPALWDILTRVCENLNIPPNAVEAFVFASPEIQAECHSGGDQGCIIRFTSGLVNLLSPREFAFVAGHELGHFLLGHGRDTRQFSRGNLEQFMQKRYQEISSDRMGLLGAQSLEAALRAMMKLTSGLGSEHLRFDVGRFVSQLGEPRVGTWLFDDTGTHPSMLVRCRALLWFSMADDVFRKVKAHEAPRLSTLDVRVLADLRRFVDGPARRQIEEARDDVLLWLAAKGMQGSHALSPTQEAALTGVIGDATLTKLRTYLSSLPEDDIPDILRMKLKEAEARLRTLAPDSFETIRGNIEIQVGQLLEASG